MGTKIFNRRSFLKAAALVGMGGTLASLSACSQISSNPKAASEQVDASAEVANIEVAETVSYDVVVVGAGASGISAAVRAAEEGAKVALIEKSASIGGCSLSVVSALVRSADADLTDEVNEWVADSHWRVSTESIYALLRNSEAAFTWLSESEGFAMTANEATGLWALPGTIKDRAEIRTTLYEDMIHASGVELYCNTTAKKLVIDEAGTIVGIVALDSDGKGIQFDSKAIAIATGGYAANREMVKEAFGFDGVCDGLPQNVGEGLEMAWAIGAKKPINFGGQMLHQTLTPCTDSLLEQFDPFPARYPFLTSYMPQFMNVTAKGRRFRNEDFVRKSDAAANSSAFQGAFHYVVISGGQLNKLAAGGMKALGVESMPPIPPRFRPEGFAIDAPWVDPFQVFEAACDGENCFAGDTFEALAEAAGIDPSIFATECDNYESYCANSRDTQMGKSAVSLIPMGDGPYFLVKTEQNNLTSWGGLATDASYRVYDINDEPIPGLWGLGIEAGTNLYNDTYVGNGVGICLAVTSGYVAGAEMAEYSTL